MSSSNKFSGTGSNPGNTGDVKKSGSEKIREKDLKDMNRPDTSQSGKDYKDTPNVGTGYMPNLSNLGGVAADTATGRSSDSSFNQRSGEDKSRMYGTGADKNYASSFTTASSTYGGDPNSNQEDLTYDATKQGYNAKGTSGSSNYDNKSQSSSRGANLGTTYTGTYDGQAKTANSGSSSQYGSSDYNKSAGSGSTNYGTGSSYNQSGSSQYGSTSGSNYNQSGSSGSNYNQGSGSGSSQYGNTSGSNYNQSGSGLGSGTSKFGSSSGSNLDQSGSGFNQSASGFGTSSTTFGSSGLGETSDKGSSDYNKSASNYGSSSTGDFGGTQGKPASGYGSGTSQQSGVGSTGSYGSSSKLSDNLNQHAGSGFSGSTSSEYGKQSTTYRNDSDTNDSNLNQSGYNKSNLNQSGSNQSGYNQGYNQSNYDQSKNQYTNSDNKSTIDKVMEKANEVKDNLTEKVQHVMEGEKGGLTDKIKDTYHKVTDTISSAAEKIGIKSKDDHDQNKPKH